MSACRELTPAACEVYGVCAPMCMGVVTYLFQCFLSRTEWYLGNFGTLALSGELGNLAREMNLASH